MKHMQLIKVLFACLLASNINFAVATTIHADASALAVLKVTGINNVTNPGDISNLQILAIAGILTDDGEGDFDTSEVTFPSSLTNVNIGSGLFQLTSVEADATGISSSAAFLESLGLISLQNNSLTDTFEIDFILDYTLSALASTVTDLVLEDAFGIAEIVLFNDFFDIDFTETAEADGLFGPTEDFLSDSFDFTLTLAPDTSDVLTLDVTSGAFTQSNQIPEPAVIMLFSLGLCALGWQKKHKLVINSHSII